MRNLKGSESPAWLRVGYGSASRWELLLADVGLTEDEALTLLGSELAAIAPRARRIALWVRLHARYAFVPEAALAACGISESELGDALDQRGYWRSNPVAARKEPTGLLALREEARLV